MALTTEEINEQRRIYRIVRSYRRDGPGLEEVEYVDAA